MTDAKTIEEVVEFCLSEIKHHQPYLKQARQGLCEAGRRLEDTSASFWVRRGGYRERERELAEVRRREDIIHNAIEILNICGWDAPECDCRSCKRMDAAATQEQS